MCKKIKDDRLPSVLFRNYWTVLPEILYVEFSEANPRNLPSGLGIDLIRNANFSTFLIYQENMHFRG